MIQYMYIHTFLAGESKVSGAAETLSAWDVGPHEIDALSFVTAVTSILTFICRHNNIIASEFTNIQ